MTERKPRIKIYVRNVTGKLPVFAKDANGRPDVHRSGQWFYLEAHARDLIGWFGPLALGVVHVSKRGPYLYSVMVVDGARQKGLGEMIVEAAGKRWPGIYWHGCGASADFHTRLVQKGVAVQRENGEVYDFVPKDQRQQ